MWIMFGYPGFNQSPPGRIVLISRRESPDTVEVVGQHHHRVDRKRALGIDVAKSLPHEINGLLIAEQPLSQRGDDGEKVSAARYERSSILHDPNRNCGMTPGMSDYASLIRPTLTSQTEEKAKTLDPRLQTSGMTDKSRSDERSVIRHLFSGVRDYATGPLRAPG